MSLTRGHHAHKDQVPLKPLGHKPHRLNICSILSENFADSSGRRRFSHHISSLSYRPPSFYQKLAKLSHNLPA